VSSNLSVSDIERLAKAGVKIEFKDIALQVQPDMYPSPGSYDEMAPKPPRSLSDSFWQRWERANPRKFGAGEMRPWDIHATEFGDKVYVYVAPTDGEPFILEDSKPLFPSDALMAALHLREKSK
jgi:hypothetical protein